MAFMAMEILVLCLRCCSVIGDHAPLRGFGVYLSLSDIYLNLGYSGRAAICLTYARDLLKQATKSEEFQFHIAYGEYLNQINNHQKFIELRPKISQAFCDSSVLFQYSVKRIQATINFFEGNSSLALSSALENHKYLTKLLKSKEIESDKAIDRNDCLKEIYGNLRLITDIFKFQGVPQGCEYYLQFGRDLAKKIGHCYYESSFTYEVSSLKKMAGDSKTVENLIEKLHELTLGVCAKLSAYYRITAGDHLDPNINNGLAPEGEYRVAIQEISNELNSTTIQEIDESLFGNSNSPKELITKANGLELVKSEAHCKIGSLLIHRKEYSKAEDELQLAGLKLNPTKDLVKLIN